MRLRPANRLPDWRNIADVLERKIPSRPTLFELFLNDRLIRAASGMSYDYDDGMGRTAAMIRANDLLGYDYTILFASDFQYRGNKLHYKHTISLNENPIITDRASFDRYPWPDPKRCDNTFLDRASEYLPQGMRFMIWSWDGLLETVIKLLGYDNLCLLLYDDESLVSDVFERVGQGYLDYFKLCVAHQSVMALVSSDDWGFNTQTFLPPDVLRKYLFPWQREYVRLAHQHGKYAVLHSCGNYSSITQDIVDMGFDARHSFEDAIIPVEDAYAQLCGRIAVLGGLDVDYLVRASEAQIIARSRSMLQASANRGGYALGSGNSIPDYIPDDHYFAMISQAW